MMKRNVRSTRYFLWATTVVWIVAPAYAQVVRYATVVKQSPSVEFRIPGPDPPESDGDMDVGVFYTELWATLVGLPPAGLACVYAELIYDRTDLIDAVEPAESSPFLPIEAVPAVFDDPAGVVRDLGGCQPIPAIEGYGVGEWVMFKRIKIVGLAQGGPITVTATPNNNIFAGTSIIGDPNPVDPDDIEVEPAPTFNIVASIPAVTDWGLVVMTLLMLTAGAIVFSRRKSARRAA